MKIAENVPEFCNRHHLSILLVHCLALVYEKFECVGNLTVDLETDPESGEQWLLIYFLTRGEQKDIMKQHNNYTDAFINMAEVESLRKIRLAFSFGD